MTYAGTALASHLSYLSVPLTQLVQWQNEVARNIILKYWCSAVHDVWVCC